jgi:cytochrome c biogenesis protein CcmG/thiol:disulfide interchange protein DsbE
MNRLIFLAPAALFVALMAAFALGLQHDPSRLPSVLIDKPVPAFDLAAVRGPQGLKTADFQGQPTLLNVFGSWCVACRYEHPLLLRLKAEGVPIRGLDWKDDVGAKYLAENGDPYDLVGDDKSGRAAIDLGVTGAPETFIVDRKGRIRYKHIGPIEPKDWDRTIKPLMDKLRAEP